MRSVSFAACLLAFPLTAFAQQDTPVATTGTLSVSAKLVVVPAIVRDKHGALVGTLGKDDFALKVDGKPQTVKYFDHENGTPLTLGLLVDTSRSQSAVLDDERTASTKFLQTMLQPAAANRAADKAFVIQFARDVELLQDVTDSRPKLQEALKLVDSESPSFRKTSDDNSGNDQSIGDNGSGRRGGYNRGSGGGTALYDAVFLSADEVTSKQKGRRAVILLTDGVDRGSKKTLAASIESAQRADTILYAIYFKGESHHDSPFSGPGGGRRGGGFPGGGGGGGGYPGGGGGGQRRGGEDNVDGKKILERMCGETGGRVFEVKGKETVEAIYNEIGDELRAQYRLGFSPSSEATAEGYHQVELDMAGAQAKNKLTVQTRDGYYTGSK